MISKASVGPHQPDSFLQFLAGYTWGRSGYAYDSNTAPLLLRFAFVNALALLPAWAFVVWDCFIGVKAGSARLLWSFAPVFVALIEVLALRNYFCHHPWMGSPHLLLAAVLSLRILHSGAPADNQVSWKSSPARGDLTVAAILAAIYIFSLSAVLFYREHGRSVLSLVSMIRENTTRGDVVAMARAQDPRAPLLAGRLPEQLDRSIVVIDALPDIRHPVPASFFLSPTRLSGSWRLVAQMTVSPTDHSLAGSISEWYIRTIARRKPVEWLTLAPDYYLYRVPQDLATTSAAHDHAR